MQASQPNVKKIGVPLVLIALIAVIMLLSNRTVDRPNGVPIVTTGQEYQMMLEKVMNLSRPAVNKFYHGDEINADDRKKALEGAKLMDSMNAFKPEAAVGFYEAGFLYYLAGDSEACLQRLNQSGLDTKLPDNILTADDRFKMEGVIGDVHHVQSLVAFDQHDYVKAEKEATEAIQHRINSPWYYVARARAEVQLKKTAEAHKDLGVALKLDPNYVPAQSLLKLIS